MVLSQSDSIGKVSVLRNFNFPPRTVLVIEPSLPNLATYSEIHDLPGSTKNTRQDQFGFKI